MILIIFIIILIIMIIIMIITPIEGKGKRKKKKKEEQGMDSEWDWQSLFDKNCGKEIMRINVFCALWCCCHYPRPQFSKKKKKTLI